MSTRAYKQITSPELKKTPSFNLWRDNTIFDFLQWHEDTTIAMSDDGGTGTITTSVKAIKELLAKVAMSEEYKKSFIEDIEGEFDDDFITYECY